MDYPCPVNLGSFADAALVLVGHGSTKNAESSAPVHQHAAELRRRGLFAVVLECLWLIEPKVNGVLARVAARRVFVVPLFLSDGFFTEEAIPEALGLRSAVQAGFDRVRQLQGRTVHYCQPVGTHASMTEVVLARARGVVERFPFPRAPRPEETTLFLAAHGTTQNENSRKAVERQVQIIRARNLYAEVHAVFMLEKPEVGECFAIARTKNIVVVPFFISDGLHVTEDIPVMLGEPAHIVSDRMKQALPTWRNPTERQGKLVWYSAGIGTEPALADVILERVKEASGWTSAVQLL